MFSKCKNEEEAKKLYKKLCLFLHPDRGGDGHLMVLLTEAYERCLSRLQPKTDVSKIYAGDSRLELLQKIDYCLEFYPQIDPTYFYSVKIFLQENGFVTSRQFTALENLFNRFKMEEFLSK